MKSRLLVTAVVGLIGILPAAAFAGRHYGGSHAGSFYAPRGSDRGDRGFGGGGWDGHHSHTGFDFSLGLGFIFGDRGYRDSGNYYYSPAYDAPPVVYSAPVVIEQPAVVYAAPVYAAPLYAAPLYAAPVYVAPAVTYAPAVSYYRYDSGYCYPSHYTRTESHYYYSR